MNLESLQFGEENHKSKDDHFKHELIQKEFRSLLENSGYELPENTEAIMVLSAPPNEMGVNFTDEKEKSPENIMRIDLAIEVCKKITAKKINKNIEQLTSDDFKNEIVPLLVLNGETEQLPMMRRIAVDDYHFPLEKIREINCGDRGIANTKTQFEATKNDPLLGKVKHITLVTTAYHIPRLAVLLHCNFQLIWILM